MRAKGDWGCRPFPLMQSPLARPTKPQIAVAADLNSRYNPLHPQLLRLSPAGSSFNWKRGGSVFSPTMIDDRPDLIFLTRLALTCVSYDKYEISPEG